jgi:hypothetical protein
MHLAMGKISLNLKLLEAYLTKMSSTHVGGHNAHYEIQIKFTITYTQWAFINHNKQMDGTLHCKMWECIQLKNDFYIFLSTLKQLFT